MNFRFCIIAVLLLTTLSFAFPKKLLLAGGGIDDDNSEVFTAFVKLATPAKGDPYIGIVTAASEASEENGKYYIKQFNTFGAKKVEWIPIDLKHIDRADDPAIVEKIGKMTGIFFGGGDQSRLVTCFYKSGRKETATLTKMRSMFESGVLAVGGTSAGTDIHQKAPMVTGGESYNALAYGSYDHEDPKHPEDLSYDIGGGFGFFTYGFLDTHFGTRGRQGRMIRLMYDLSKYGTKGVGVDENTAIVVIDNKFEVIGYNGVYVLDTTNAKLTEDLPLNLDNIRVTYLTKGDVFNMDNDSITWAGFKQNIKGKEKYLYPSTGIMTDIFSSPHNHGRSHPELFTNATLDLFNSALVTQRYAYTYEKSPRFRVDFTKTSDSVGVVGTKDSVTYISYQNLKMKIAQDSNSLEMETI